jgi:hypothetical protein
MHPQFLAGIRSNALGPIAKVHIDLTNCFLSPRELEQFAVAVNKNIGKNADILCPMQTINLCGNEICGVDMSGEGTEPTKHKDGYLLHGSTKLS